MMMMVMTIELYKFSAKCTTPCDKFATLQVTNKMNKLDASTVFQSCQNSITLEAVRSVVTELTNRYGLVR
jgi:hypothetical protein